MFRSRFVQKVVIIDVFLKVIVQKARVFTVTCHKYTQVDHGHTPACVEIAYFCESYVFYCVFSHLAGFGVTGKGGRGKRFPSPPAGALTRLDPEGRRIV